MNVGQLVCGGFQGTTVTPHATRLVVEQRVLTMIISRKNTVDVKQTTKLLRDLQWLAYSQGNYTYPIMFCLDEEGGMMNSLFDPHFLSQFPLAMALSATQDTDLIYQCAKALAVELRRIGFSMILGPVLDVVTKLSHQLVGVRAFATTPEDVIKYGRLCAKGFQDGGLLTVGKHFPGIGNAAVDSLMELPMMVDLLDQIRQYNLVPFAQLINDGLLDGISAAGCGVPTISPDETHACLLPVLLTQLLRHELGFDGFVISECLEMEALCHSIGLSQGVILALLAGCDLVLVCQDEAFQKEALEAISKGLANGILEEEAVATLMRRIEALQRRCRPWSEIFPLGKQNEEALIPFREAEPEQWQRHQLLSVTAYKKLITLVRDLLDTLPLTKHLPVSEQPANVLLLTPLLTPIYPSVHVENEPQHMYKGEEVLQHFGDALANHPANLGDRRRYNVLHTTYTANGLTQLHELLIARLKVVIVLTLEALRNMYQIGIVKYVLMLCGALPAQVLALLPAQLSKPLVVVATLLPYDFFYNRSLGLAYLCCYDYTNQALDQLVKVLMGDDIADGCVPGEEKFIGKPRAQVRLPLKPHRRWLVDEFDLTRDWQGLLKLWEASAHSPDDRHAFDYGSDGFYKRLYALLTTRDPSQGPQRHFVVRNSLLNILYGAALTWVDDDHRGHLVFIVVDKLKRLQLIGKNLYTRAVRYLVKERGCATVQMGLSFPMVSPNSSSSPLVKSFLLLLHWQPQKLPKKYIMVLRNMPQWQVPKKIFRELMIVGVRFDICADALKLMPMVAQTCGTTKALYLEAIRLIHSNGVKIVTALEPTNQLVIGLIVLFTNKSQLLKYFPFIDDCVVSGSERPPRLGLLELLSTLTGDPSVAAAAPVAGIVAPLVDLLYSNLTEILKYGLICLGITLLKLLESNMYACVMIGVEDGKMKQGAAEIGFADWKLFHDGYGVKAASELAL